MEENCFTCTHCGHTHPRADLTGFDGWDLCPNCLDAMTVVCQDCERRIWRDDNAGSEDHPLCEHCYEDSYTRCNHCETLLHFSDACYEEDDEDQDYPYCSRCIGIRDNHATIHNYHYKPAPIFYGEGNRYLGVELEIDQGGESRSNARQIMEAAHRNGLEYIYCKHDGSLDDGFEIVTHPMTLDFHMAEMPWSAVLNEAVNMHYLSHRANTCGLHVHVNRSAFGDTEAEQDAVIARILYFFEKFWDELLKFSRRTRRQLEEWANRYGYKDQPREILDHAKGYNSPGRYSCVNLTPKDTIEFRIFRGTLKLNTLLATLQLVDRICDVAIALSDDEVRSLSWTTFAAGCTRPELVQYLKERRLYVNEPVTVIEEV